ncbi:MAG: SDR family oxidoreductase [Cyanobacteriota bacterium]|nr:SDR family oxidoreductase [Cyanobacteriota bacterium]
MKDTRNPEERTPGDRDSTNVLNPWPTVNPRALASIGRLVIFGGGYTGTRLGQALAAHGVPVTLTHRQPTPPPDLPAHHWLRFDSAPGVLPGATDLAGMTHLLVTIPPNDQGLDPVLSALLPLVRQAAPVWVGLLSTTGVYGDHGGRWVDEETPPQPAPGRSQARLRCEQAWRESGLPLQIFRLPAIYGPGRSPFAALLEGRSRLIHKPGQVFSRIHVDDIVGALLHSLSLPAGERPPLLNLADAEPCPSSETLGYAAHLLGHKLPPFERFADVAERLGPMARSFWMENRRADSRRLRDRLGYSLRYPSYREGYREGCQADWIHARR